MEVRPDGRPPFRAQLGEPFIATDFWRPEKGETVGVEFDAASGKVRFDKSDPRLGVKARVRAKEKADKRRFEEKLKG